MTTTSQRHRPTGVWIALTTAALLAGAPEAAHAYIGPGAGFAFAGSMLVLLVTFALAFAISCGGAAAKPRAPGETGGVSQKKLEKIVAAEKAGEDLGEGPFVAEA